VKAVVGDVNGDGRLDLVFSTTIGLPVVLVRDFVTGQTLNLFVPFPICLPAFSLSVANVDNAGADEIVLTITASGVRASSVCKTFHVETLPILTSAPVGKLRCGDRFSTVSGPSLVFKASSEYLQSTPLCSEP
jgi:hypothetical protein